MKRFLKWLPIILLLVVMVGCALTDDQINQISNQVGHMAAVAAQNAVGQINLPAGPGNPEGGFPNGAAGGIGAVAGLLAAYLTRLLLKTVQRKKKKK